MIIGAELDLFSMMGSSMGTIGLVMASFVVGGVLTIIVVGAINGSIPFLSKYNLDATVWQLRHGGKLVSKQTKIRPKMMESNYEAVAIKQGFMKPDIIIPSIKFTHINQNEMVHLFSPARGQYRIAQFVLAETPVIDDAGEFVLDETGKQIMKFKGSVEPIASQSDLMALAQTLQLNKTMFLKESIWQKLAPYITIIITCLCIGLIWYFALSPLVDFAESWSIAAEQMAASVDALGGIMNTVFSTTAPITPPPAG